MTLRSMVRSLFGALGYDLVRRDAGLTQPNPYMVNIPYGYATFAPWFLPEFTELYAKIADNTVVREDRAYSLRQLANYALQLPGQFAECGVYRGGTAWLLADTLRPTTKSIHLFDTFAGMPQSADADPSSHQRGDFGDTSLDAVKSYLAEHQNLQFFPGYIPDTFGGLEDQTYAFVHVDVDLYQSVKDCCEFFYPRLTDGGIMVFDDYGFRGYVDAAKKAVDEFFGDRPETPLALRTGQCVVIKLPHSAAEV